MLSRLALCTLALGGLPAADAVADAPHLAQAWQAESTGDGLKGATGLESYLYEDCAGGKSDTCMQGHVFDYGAASCVKYEVDRGNSPFTGTFYVKCKGGLNCCIKDKGAHRRPDVKKWDIGMGKGLSGDTITSLGKVMTLSLIHI